jgi:hypothetical protein
MSGQIKLKAATLGGDITLSPTDTASNLVVTIPAVTSTLVNEASDITAQVKTATNATGTAPIYAARAWVNFDGTGTVAIRASGNVSSITDNGTGDYTVNFTTAMEDVNYIAVFSGANVSSGRAWGLGNAAPTTSAIRLISFGYNGGALSDTAHSFVSIFR